MEVWAGNGWLPVINPATQEQIGRVPVMSRQQVRESIQCAMDAFQGWSKLPAKDRAKLLRDAAVVIYEEIDRLSRILTAEQGKPLSEARGELTMAAEYLEWFSEESRRIYGELIPASAVNKRLQVIRQPVGVVGAITPWNFPASMVTRKIAPALAAGCTVVLKPASATPLTAIALFEIFQRIGFPPGVTNLVVGSAKDIADEFLSNPIVRKVSFTGSTEVGRTLIRGGAEQIKKLSLELGGHAPFLVFDDCDLNDAVQGVIASKYRNAGQTCICANRLYVQSNVLEEFQYKLAAAVSHLKVGNGLDDGVDIGPMINTEARDHVINQVRDAVQRGGKVLTGGKIADVGLPGAFYSPTLLANVSDDAMLTREETFGPLIGIRSFESEEEAIRLANDTPYGLAAYVYTRDLGRVTRVSEALEYGIVGVNDPVPTVVQAPFGGIKESGWGREGGWQGIDAYLETKFISIRY
ncbi:NAD-dependent succinate-semialdehyde dehydrogenase [Fodinisporobacter ferrooxydans]|uniref:NAD-dependent succinate-semialdehyde dehydrogenase n=2 Tax=Fodinisporobacter ferrooxydans TaxID=2901836 RepID=A0ABY4CYC9_9BACL|nr:NAD-dependent succinate-semialdehyde dehydrogenase [Alicyclobacillaceae bacterium MYW30-H2]